MSNDIKSREVAFLVLKKVLDDAATLERSIDKYATDLSAQDRGFIRHLTTTAIRRLGQLDKIINHCTKTKLGNTQMAIRHVLRLGITQLLYTEVPAHAAVNTSVSLVAKRVPKKLHYLKNTVNAVLRKVDRERETLLKKYSNTRLNFPPWLLKRWDNRFGQSMVKEILDALLNEAPLDLSIRPEHNQDEWAEKLKGIVMPGGAIRIEKAGKVRDIIGYDDGIWWVQDMAARLPAILLGAGQGDGVLDLCAAPGGKAAQSAANGAMVTAVDFSESRLIRLKQNMERLKLKIDVVTSDVLTYEPQKSYDYILLDAPCSSTGTIRRHPEILHTRRPEDVKELSILQGKMLDHAVSLLNDGGILIYSVCSMEQSEGPDQINALLQRHGSLKRKEIINEEIPGLEQSILEIGDVQTLPHYISGGMDGFFISRLVKVSK
ncbi:MAG: 16S rRNA (cytosine(967)-C(5))-methyltransferase RsmB [Emcibacteraceae bacterium]|nr:16S rRNA (cytosine(967)-C(5))-methyltransferase RsmB [Emcibacteraceae bacterium]